MPFGNSATQTTNCYGTGSCACLPVRDYKMGYKNMKLVFELDSKGSP
jgi:hypothetical protein